MKQLSLEAFLDACGGRGPLQMDVTAPDENASVRQVLHQPFALLGRHPSVDVCLQGSGVSRRHALLQVIAGRYFCLDLGSRTGTYWDGQGQGHGWLPGHAPFRVGPYRLSLAEESRDGDPVPADDWNPLERGSTSTHALPTVTLNILDNGRFAYRWRMNRAMAIVGNAENCKVRLQGPGVSRFQCALVCTPVGVWVVDLRRNGGIPVNETAVTHALLEDGDRLQVGNYTICVSYDSPDAPATAASSVTSPIALFSGPPSGPAPNNLVSRSFGAAQSLDSWRDPSATPMVAPSSTVGTPAAVPGEAGNVELIAGMMRQFSQMQHQMFDQSLVMMFQMFRTMHGEQTSILREELGRLDAINRELQSLLAEQLKIAPPAASVSTPATRAVLSAVSQPPGTEPSKTAATSSSDKSGPPPR
jgi:pSer/pThr/pTyr-binding forkhead associated (FHA) protein